ncbi:SecY-interacting protein [uncultured Ferrimonas sp.]|uniref:SecY-interacting protein n=1 Tax=uncultured Ferrimonas sp. TaxID=432640 RepID=UPI002606E33C|nr:SecY-interacting protein [uncultured Ferrimonas sp.]
MSETPLAQFIQLTETAWLQQHQHLPVTDRDEPSPALRQPHQTDGLCYWQASPMAPNADLFENVATALELPLHSDLTRFYGQFYAGSLLFDAEFGRGELLQVWNDEDLQRLQENLIGHLLMKRKLKQAPTLFIGLLGQGEQMIVLDNDDGSVWLEIPGQSPDQQLAPTLHQFLALLTPRLQTPEPQPEEPAMAAMSLSARLGAMWQHLMSWRKR